MRRLVALLPVVAVLYQAAAAAAATAPQTLSTADRQLARCTTSYSGASVRFDGCEQLDLGLELYWRFLPNDAIEAVIQKQTQDEYIAFGFSSDESGGAMVPNKVVAGFVRPGAQPRPFFEDYSLQAYSSAGVVPGSGGQQIRDFNASYTDGLLQVRFTRPLTPSNGDSLPTLAPNMRVGILWAIGEAPRSGFRLSYHTARGSSTIRLRGPRAQPTRDPPAPPQATEEPPRITDSPPMATETPLASEPTPSPTNAPPVPTETSQATDAPLSPTDAQPVGTATPIPPADDPLPVTETPLASDPPPAATETPSKSTETPLATDTPPSPTNNQPMATASPPEVTVNPTLSPTAEAPATVETPAIETQPVTDSPPPATETPLTKTPTATPAGLSSETTTTPAPGQKPPPVVIPPTVTETSISPTISSAAEETPLTTNDSTPPTQASPMEGPSSAPTALLPATGGPSMVPASPSSANSPDSEDSPAPSPVSPIATQSPGANDDDDDDDGTGVCFPGDSVVELSSGELRRMADLETGARVRTGPGSSDTAFSEVFFFSHRDPHAVSTFVEVSMANQDHTLRLSPSHFVVTADGSLVTGRGLEIGMVLVASNGSTAEISSLKQQRMTGLFAPHTIEGKNILFVDGFQVSEFTQAVHPRIARVLLYPLKRMYRIGALNGILGSRLFVHGHHDIARKVGLSTTNHIFGSGKGVTLSH